MSEPYVAVVGPGRGATDAHVRAAREVGELLGRAGAVVVTGGSGGVMSAAAEGAARVGGCSVGLLPGDGRGEGSAHLTVSLPTGLGELRNGLLPRVADALICIGGSWGTLSEVALAVRTGVPVVCLSGWRIFDADGAEMVLPQAADVSTAVDAVLAAARARATGG